MALSEPFSSLALRSHPGVEWAGGWACLKDASIKAEGGLSCEMTYCFPYRGLVTQPSLQHTVLKPRLSGLVPNFHLHCLLDSEQSACCCWLVAPWRRCSVNLDRGWG